MFHKFTEKAIKVLMLAQEESRRLSNKFVYPETLFLGVIGAGSKTSDALKDAGLTIARARIETEKVIGRRNEFVLVEMPFTENAKRALERSWEEAQKLGHEDISPAHLLLGLLPEDETENSVFLILSELNISAEALRAAAHEVLKNNPMPRV